MHTQEEIKSMSDQQLLSQYKIAQSTLIVTCVLIGALVGVAVFSAFRNGIGFFTFFPIFFVFIIVNGQKKHKAIKEEIKFRKLK